MKKLFLFSMVFLSVIACSNLLSEDAFSPGLGTWMAGLTEGDCREFCKDRGGMESFVNMQCTCRGGLE